MKKTIILSILCLLAFSPVLAKRSFDRTVTISKTGEVRVEIIAGSLNFIPWDKAELRVSGTLGDDVEDVEIDAEGGDVDIEVKLRSGHNLNDASAFLTIQLPTSVSLEAEAISADVKAGALGGGISFEVISGDVTISGASGPIDVEAISGNVALDTASANLDIEAVSGTIRVQGDRLQGGTMECVSGAILVDADLATGCRLKLSTVSGRVEVTLPTTVSASFDVESFSGSIRNDFGPEAERASRFLPAKSLEFETGTATARISIETHSGNIKLIKRD